MRCFKSECRSAGVSGETLHRQGASQLPPPTDIHLHSFLRGILSRIDHKTFFHFHACFVSQRPRRPSFPALLSSGRNKTRKEEKELSFLSFQLLTYFPLTKNLQFLFLLFFFFLLQLECRERHESSSLRAGLHTSTSGICPQPFQTPSAGSFPRGYRFWTCGMNPED